VLVNEESKNSLLFEEYYIEAATDSKFHPMKQHKADESVILTPIISKLKLSYCKECRWHC